MFKFNSKDFEEVCGDIELAAHIASVANTLLGTKVKFTANDFHPSKYKLEHTDNLYRYCCYGDYCYDSEDHNDEIAQVASELANAKLRGLD